MALAVAMAIPMTMILPTTADAYRIPESYDRYHNCRVSGRPGWYCRMTDSEQRVHDEKVRREEEARREAERRAAEQRRRQKEREARERVSRSVTCERRQILEGKSHWDAYRCCNGGN